MLSAATCLLAATAVHAQEAVREAAAPKTLTLEDVLGRKGPRVRSSVSATWAQGRFVRVREGRVSKLLDPALLATGDSAVVNDPDRPDRPARAPRAQVALKDGMLRVVSPEDGERLVDIGAGRPREMHTTENGQRASFVRGHDLHLVDAVAGEVWQVTNDGAAAFDGLLDWVYQEEIYGRGNFQGHWWSPNGRHVAFLSLDQTGVRDFTVVDHVPPGGLAKERAVVAEVSTYPKVGDPNPTVQLKVADSMTQEVRTLDLSAYPEDSLVVRVGFNPEGSKVIFIVQDRIQTWAALCSGDPVSGEVTEMLKETSDTWTNRPSAPRWLEDGSFLWMSERTGYQHIEHRAADGSLIRRLTDGEWQVKGLTRVDEERGLIWFTATKDSAIDSNLYRVPLAADGPAGGEVVRLTPGRGSHRAQLDGSGQWILDTFSAVGQPPVVRLLNGEGEVVAEFGKGRIDANGFAVSMPELLSIPARDGYELDAILTPALPVAGMERHPIMVETYSGPDAPSVRNSFRLDAWHQFLAQQGIHVLQCNVRSASGRGQAHTGTCYLQLGLQEIKDLEDAVAFVCAERGGNPDKVGIRGWSYGGFMAAMALTHSDKFTLGLAGGGVYDWRLYDTIYTERYMGLLSDNQEGYEKTSVIGHVDGLDEDEYLVICHGTMDDNVHLQNAMQLTYALQLAGKDNFETMFYPRSRHGVRNRAQTSHMRRLHWRAIEKHLLN